jgi:hypothetical protein
MNPHQKAAHGLHKHFAMFARNGRWGTCVACPCDGHYNKIPELCEFTDRYDHHLKLEDLLFQFNHTVKEHEKAKESV